MTYNKTCVGTPIIHRSDYTKFTFGLNIKILLRYPPLALNNNKNAFYSIETILDIVNCNGKTMTLESDYERLELRKF